MKITVEEAAKELGCDKETIRQGLRNKTFPIGTAVKTANDRWTYLIPKEAFEKFMRGELR